MKPLFSIALLASMILNSSLLTAAEPTTAPPKQITNSIGMKLTLVPSGEFMMGSKESAEETAAFFNKTYGGGLSECRSISRTSIRSTACGSRKPFYLGTYHVTRGQFRQFVADTGYKTDAETRDEARGLGLEPRYEEGRLQREILLAEHWASSRRTSTRWCA